jgi:hypothetical protein
MSSRIAVGNFRTKLDAEIAGGLLDNADVPYIIQSQEGMLHGPIMPGATILVSAEDEKQARQILQDANMIEPNGS